MMFKKFALLLAPFVLSPLGSLLTPSAAHAQTQRWTGTVNCVFSTWPGGGLRDFTKWRALIETRSDGAVRAVQVEFGQDGNQEYISVLEVDETRMIDGQGEVYVKDSLRTKGFVPPVTSFKTPIMSLPWVSNLYRPRYVRVKMIQPDNRDCTSKISF
jgi:hypothetical protein